MSIYNLDQCSNGRYYVESGLFLIAHVFLTDNFAKQLDSNFNNAEDLDKLSYYLKILGESVNPLDTGSLTRKGKFPTKTNQEHLFNRAVTILQLYTALMNLKEWSFETNGVRLSYRSVSVRSEDRPLQQGVTLLSKIKEYKFILEPMSSIPNFQMPDSLKPIENIDLVSNSFLNNSKVWRSFISNLNQDSEFINKWLDNVSKALYSDDNKRSIETTYSNMIETDPELDLRCVDAITEGDALPAESTQMLYTGVPGLFGLTLNFLDNNKYRSLVIQKNLSEKDVVKEKKAVDQKIIGERLKLDSEDYSHDDFFSSDNANLQSTALSQQISSMKNPRDAVSLLDEATKSASPDEKIKILHQTSKKLNLDEAIKKDLKDNKIDATPSNVEKAKIVALNSMFGIGANKKLLKDIDTNLKAQFETLCLLDYLLTNIEDMPSPKKPVYTKLYDEALPQYNKIRRLSLLALQKANTLATLNPAYLESFGIEISKQGDFNFRSSLFLNRETRPNPITIPATVVSTGITAATVVVIYLAWEGIVSKVSLLINKADLWWTESAIPELEVLCEQGDEAACKNLAIVKKQVVVIKKKIENISNELSNSFFSRFGEILINTLTYASYAALGIGALWAINKYIYPVATKAFDTAFDKLSKPNTEDVDV